VVCVRKGEGGGGGGQNHLMVLLLRLLPAPVPDTTLGTITMTRRYHLALMLENGQGVTKNRQGYNCCCCCCTW
jgi:hypothetical protein